MPLLTKKRQTSQVTFCQLEGAASGNKIENWTCVVSPALITSSKRVTVKPGAFEYGCLTTQQSPSTRPSSLYSSQGWSTYASTSRTAVRTQKIHQAADTLLCRLKRHCCRTQRETKTTPVKLYSDPRSPNHSIVPLSIPMPSFRIWTTNISAFQTR